VNSLWGPLPLRIANAWSEFWFGAPAPNTVLALLRIGTGWMLLYVLFLRSFDLDGLFVPEAAVDPLLKDALDPMAWPFSVLEWVDHSSWRWGIHILAMVTACALLAGVWTSLMAALGVVFQLSYGHAYPAMLVGVDSLLLLALMTLTLAPSGRVLGVLGRVDDEHPPLPPHLLHLEDTREPAPSRATSWKWLGLRLLQIHLCLIYFHSALAKLSSDWLAGSALWHPWWSATGAPLGVEEWAGRMALSGTLTFGLVLFEILYPCLIWVRPLRYPLLALALLVHLFVGFAWDLVPFNIMMLILNLSFLPAHHMEHAMRVARPFLPMPWLSANGARH